MDDAFSAHDEPAWLTGFDTLTGVVAREGGAWVLYPRSSDDLGEQSNAGTVADVVQAGVDCQVTLEGLVVTTPVDRIWGGLWVQDEGGGEYSGIWIGAEGVELQPGDVVDATGLTTTYADDYGGYTFLDVSSEVGGAVTATGATATPVATALDADPENLMAWDSVLVTLQDVGIAADPNGYWWIYTDLGVWLVAGFTTPMLAEGDTCASITGIGTYWGEGAIIFMPTSQDDLDCDGGEVITSSVAEVQQGELSGMFTFEGVVATSGLDAEGTAFFVQDEGGGEYAGIDIFFGSIWWASAADFSVQPGDQLSVTGFVTEYYGMTEFTVAGVAEMEFTGSSTPVATALTGLPFDWEPYEGVLVSVADLTVEGEANTYGEVETNWSDLWLDDRFYSWWEDYGDGDAFSEVAGLVTYEWNEYRLNPRSADDMSP